MKIKEAAKECALTEKAIRLYEEKGLIKPTLTELNGRNFRDYDEACIKKLKTIAALRQQYFSLAQIARMLECPQEIPQIFEEYRTSLAENHAAISALLDHTNALTEADLESAESLSDALTGREITPWEPASGWRRWDEDVKEHERERAYAAYLRHQKLRDLRDRILDRAQDFIKRRIKLILAVGIPLVILFFFLYNIPFTEKIEHVLPGVEFDEYDRDYIRHITVTVKGEFERYLFKADVFTGSIEIDGYHYEPLWDNPYIHYDDDTPIYLTVCPEKDVPISFRLECFDRGIWMLREDENKSRYITECYAKASLDQFAFPIWEMIDPAHGNAATHNGIWIAAPAETREEAIDIRYELKLALKKKHGGYWISALPQSNGIYTKRKAAREERFSSLLYDYIYSGFSTPFRRVCSYCTHPPECWCC
ncbi:MAG: MerR family transcriptional regulator [Clostridia bacterium]|nr:MerR family transcriptional regulator [Clostridia bacterium]